MGNKYLTVLGVLLVVSITGVLAGRNSQAHKGQHWEYGLLKLGRSNDWEIGWSWQDSERLVRTKSARDFAVEMHVKNYGDTVFEINVMNRLGQDGWELLPFLQKDASVRSYWFKRPN